MNVQQSKTLTTWCALAFLVNFLLPTVSLGQEASQEVTAGEIGFAYVPDQFSFVGSVALTNTDFQNTYLSYPPGTPDTYPTLLTVRDLRDSGGFSVSIAATDFTNAEGEGLDQGVSNFASTVKIATEGDSTDPEFSAGIVYDVSNTGPRDAVATADIDLVGGGNISLYNDYPFDLSSAVTLISAPLTGTTGRTGDFTFSVNTMVRVLSNTPPGVYTTTFVYTIADETT